MSLMVQNEIIGTVEKAATWGTAIATSPKGLPVDDLEIEIQPQERRIKRGRGIRGQHEGDSWNDTLGAIASARFKTPMTHEILELLLPAVLQKNPAWAAVSNVWTLYPVALASLPTIEDDEGYFFTVTRNTETADQDVRIGAAVGGSVKFSIDPGADDRLLMGEFEMFGKAYERGITAAGTVSQLALTYPYKFSNISEVTFAAGDVTADFYGLELNISLGGKFHSDVPEGQVVFPTVEVSGSFKLLASATTETMKGLVESTAINTGAWFRVVFGTDPGDAGDEKGDLAIEVFLLLKKYDCDFSEGEVVTFEFDGVFGDTGAGTPEYPVRILWGDAVPA